MQYTTLQYNYFSCIGRPLEHLGQNQYVVQYERIKLNIIFWTFIKNKLVFIHKLHVQLKNSYHLLQQWILVEKD